MTQPTNTQDKKNGSTPPPPPGANRPAPVVATTGGTAPGAATGSTGGPATGATAEGATGATPPKKKKERLNKVYVIVGQVHEFETPLKAETWLNNEPDAPTEFTVIKGQRVKSKQKVTLR